ncbi:MAG: GNAT family N-acetyltransferase [Proteobacteria bacterium]|nr:GNAT family N-acetyltransferase [Pseudomonadota bacterium]
MTGAVEDSARLSLRPLARAELRLVPDYFHAQDAASLRAMGVDPARLPPKDEWTRRIEADADLPDREKATFYLGWLVDDRLAGHSNINAISYGEEAYVHLHLWTPELRGGGRGAALFKRSAQHFLERFQLKRLVCEPYAENPAPNRVLLKAGFRFLRRYRRMPVGVIGYEQDVNRYELESATPGA